jgi:hypothetical protein
VFTVALECGDEFLGVDHGQRVAGQGERVTSEEAWDAHEDGGRRDGVADVHIDVEGHLGAGQGRGHGDPNAAVLVIVADRLSACPLGVEDQPVIQDQPSNFDD